MATREDKEALYSPGTTNPLVLREGAAVSKIMIWPSRKVNLGNYETVDLNAGVEMVFDAPVPADSPEIPKALEQARTIIREEFKRQWVPYAARTVKD